ncbi:MAG: GC-type dockerin domain-anchored protein [Phycisphaerales bacterium]
MATHYRSIDAHLNTGGEQLDILGIGTDPDDQVTYMVCHTYTNNDCPSSDPIHIYAHNPTTNQWVFEGSIDHTRSVDISCVSVNGDTVVIGRTFANFGEDGIDIYRRGPAGVWTQEAAIRPADNFPGNQFGISVSIQGDYLAVGAAKDDPDDEIHAWEGKGSVYFYQRISGQWGFIEKITVSNGLQGDDFGSSVALSNSPSGLRLIVGAPDHSTDSADVNEAGAVYAFEYDFTQGTWQQTDMAVNTTDPFTSGDYGKFGIAFDGLNIAAIDFDELHVLQMDPATGLLTPIGTWASSAPLFNPIVVQHQIMVGDPDGSLSGAAGVPNVTHILIDATNNPTLTRLPAPLFVSPGDQYARSIASNGSVLLAGVPSLDLVGQNAGALWSQDLGSNTYPTRLITEGQANNLAKFGQAIVANDQWAFVAAPDYGNPCLQGATGSVRAYRLINGQWSQVQEISPPTLTTSHGFGHALAFDGIRLAVSMPQYSETGSSTHFGAVTIYEFDGSDWLPTQFITGPSTDQGFGSDVAIDASHLAIGLDSANSHGMVSMFEYDTVNSRFGFLTDINPTASSIGSKFGATISMHAGELFIADPFNASQTGSVDHYTFDPSSGTWSIDPSFQLPPLAPGARFGSAIVQSDDIALIGLPGDANLPGKVAIYPKTPQGFAQPTLIDAPPSATATGFGASIAIEDNQIIIGHDDPSSSKAHFMAYDGSTYQHLQTVSIPSGDAGALFGSQLAIGAETLFVGAPSELDALGQRSGKVHLYESEIRFTVSECDMAMQDDRVQWIQDDITNPSEWFAYSLEVDEGYAIVGTPYEQYSFIYNGITINGNNAGKATIYERTGLRTWTPVKFFRGGNFQDSPVGTVHSDWLGWSVDIEQNLAVAGGIQARNENDPVPTGSIRIYQRGPGGWSESGEVFPATINDPTPTPIREFGSAVDIDSTATFIAVGASNSAVGFTGTGAGFIVEQINGIWTPSEPLVAPNMNFADHMGKSAAVEEQWAAFGVVDDDTAGSGSGAIHLFKRSPAGSWSFHSTIVSPTGTQSSRFGSAIELSRSDLGLALVASAPSEVNGTTNSTGAGFIYVLDETTDQWNLIQRLDPEFVTSSVLYGKDISIDHNTIAVGAPSLRDSNGGQSVWTGGVEMYNLDPAAAIFVRKTTIRPQTNQWNSPNGWGNSIGLSGGTVFMGTELADNEMYDPATQNLNYGAVVAYDIICVPDCPADINNDGVVDFFDISLFLAAFGTGDPSADINADGIINFFDVSAFLTLYSAGC